VISHAGRILSLQDCRKIHLALSRDLRDAVGADEHGRDRDIAAKLCLVGQPVASGPAAALRICAGARLVTATWTADQDTARDNLQRELGSVSAVVAKIEWLLAHIDDL
jgi:UDP-N-acetylglucosamine transferase subunit ALG13